MIVIIFKYFDCSSTDIMNKRSYHRLGKPYLYPSSVTEVDPEHFTIGKIYKPLRKLVEFVLGISGTGLTVQS